MDIPSNWKGLIDEATKHEAQLLAKAIKANTQMANWKIEVKAQ